MISINIEISEELESQLKQFTPEMLQELKLLVIQSIQNDVRDIIKITKGYGSRPDVIVEISQTEK